MALDKLVDSTQLDSDLTAVANAIRTKGGTSAALAFPSGFVSAVEAIPSGGGTTITDGIVVNELKTASNYIGLVPKSITLYTNGLVPAFALGAAQVNNRFYWLETITHIPNAPVTYVDTRAFSFCPAVTKEIAESVFANVEWCSGERIFEGCTGISGNIEFPNLEEFNQYGRQSQITYDNRDGALFVNCTNITGISMPKLKHILRRFAFRCTSLTSGYFPKCQYLLSPNAGAGAFQNCTSLETIQFGSIGTSCEVRHPNAFSGCTQNTLTITVYCIGSLVDSNVSHIRYGATNATIIIKASEATTYNGTSYAAGDTILTSEVA